MSKLILTGMDYFMQSNISAIVGPFDLHLAMSSEKIGIPFLMTSLYDEGFGRSTFNMLPTSGDIRACLVDIMKSYGWKHVGVIYDTGFGE